jgi:hypothetical protein
MKSIIGMFLAAVLLFTLSAAVSLYISSLRRPTDPASESGKEKEAKAREKTVTTPPAIVEPQPPKSAEEAAALLARVRDRQIEVQRREEEARKQEQRLQLMMDDLKGERVVIDNLRKQFSDEMKKINEKQEDLVRRSRGLEEQKAAAKRLLDEMKSRQVEFEKGEAKNIDKIASTLESVPPEKGAQIIKQMADNGQIDTAVKLLSQMQGRRAANILAELTDVALAAQLIDKLRGVKR